MENQVVKSEEQSVFVNTQAFEHAQRVAKMLSNSDLVPAQFKGKIDNCLIALNMANRMGADPMMVMQNMYIVHGKPAWSSAFLIATLNACGKFSPLRYEEDDKDGGRCRAVATDIKSGEKCEGVWVTMTMANSEGWTGKSGSKWRTMPQLMMRYRAASFFTRQFAPEVSMGFQTIEEIEDVRAIVIPSVEEKSQEEHELERKRLMIADCTSIEQLHGLQENNPDWDLELFREKAEELTEKQEKKGAKK